MCDDEDICSNSSVGGNNGEERGKKRKEEMSGTCVVCYGGAVLKGDFALKHNA